MTAIEPHCRVTRGVPTTSSTTACDWQLAAFSRVALPSTDPTAREQVDDGEGLDELNEQVAEHVGRMEESEVVRYLIKYVLIEPEPVPSTASWRRPPPPSLPDTPARDVHDLGACLCGCSDALWAAESVRPSWPREI